MQRNCLSLAKQRSMRLRSRYSALSQARGCWQLRGGITGWAPSEWICATSCRLSWPLSAKTHLGLNPASSAGACVMSLRWPPVRINRTGRPWPSTAMWIFVLSPPGQRPRAGCVAPLSRSPPVRAPGQCCCRSSDTRCFDPESGTATPAPGCPWPPGG